MDAGIDEDGLGTCSSLFEAGSPSSYFGISRSTEEVELLHDGGFMASLESGGAILNSGRWSVSTSARGESVQWSVVNEDLLDPWIPKQVGHTASIGRSPAKAKSPSTDLSGVIKPDPGEEWASAIDQETHGGRAGAGSSISTGLSKARPRRSSASSEATEASGVKVEAEDKGVETSPQGAEEDEEEEEEEEEEDEEEDKDNDDEDFGKCENDGSEPISELSEKRRRNREHAKRSRMRKRVRLGGLEEMVLELRRENVRLRQIVKKGIPDKADDIIRSCASDNTDADLVAKQDVVQGMRPNRTVAGSGWGCLSSGSRSRPRVDGSGRSYASRDRRVPSALKLMSPSYQSVKALSESQANFILTNPNLPGCPIIFASPGFLELTGYEANQVIGKNCRFLQGPGTDPVTVSIIRTNLAEGRDTSVCILNYKADGTPFWNQLSIGNLLDAHGQVANNVGVLCEVKQMPAADFHRLLHRVPLPEVLLHDTSSDSGDEVVDSKRYGRPRHAGGRQNSGSGAPAFPRVVDRLRRTRAASAADQAASQAKP